MTTNDSGPLLSDRDDQILLMERQWFRHVGAKEAAIRATFGMTPTRYYQVLNALLDNPDAMARDPQVVARLRRLRVARQRARDSRGQVFRH